MKLKPEQAAKLKTLLQNSEPSVVLDITMYVQDLCDEAYEAGHYHRDQRNSPNYINLSAWDKYPNELRRLPEGRNLINTIRKEVEESKSSNTVSKEDSNEQQET